MLPLAQHLLLLVIHVDDGLYGPLLCAVESAVCLVIHSDEIEKREYVAVKQRKHACESILDQFRTFVFALYDIEIDCPYAVALHSGRFAYLFNAADFVYNTVNVFRAILNQINIRRISYLRIGTCRIRLDISRLCLAGDSVIFIIVALVLVFCAFFASSRVRALISSIVILLRMVVNREGSNIGWSEYSVNPHIYCIYGFPVLSVSSPHRKG